MKKGINKIISMTLALLVFATSMSYAVEMHFCAENLVDFSFFNNSDTCAQSGNDEFLKNCAISEVPCCSSEQILIEGQDNLVKVNFEDLTYSQQLFLASFTYSYINLFEGLDRKSVPFVTYAPPLLVRDILVLDQTFLI
tara:strand:+ start:2708 stop:3124 length:417 start_codon:yes stop_codon:yes gene_type:complete